MQSRVKINPDNNLTHYQKLGGNTGFSMEQLS